MGWRDWLFGGSYTDNEVPNANPSSSVGPSYNPGDPDGVTFEEAPDTEARSLPYFVPSKWSGYPAEWAPPNWDMSSRFNELVDVAWMCLDLNASVLSSMPVFRSRAGEVLPAHSWMLNPDPTIYSSWEEFAKQLFWDFQLGEVFVMRMSVFSDGYPMRFRVMPPWAMHVEMRDGLREYRLGGPTGTDVTSEVLHIRYKSSTSDPHGVGPLESAGGRMLTAAVIAKYIREFAQTGGVPLQTIETEADLEPEEAKDLQEQYMASRVQSAIAPPVFDNGGKLVDHKAVSPKDAAMLELGQFNESRIAQMLGVPPFLAGLPSGGDNMTYSNVSSLFDFHDRMRLRSLVAHVMGALSYWALPQGQRLEVNRDEYTRPAFKDRAEAWAKLKEAEIVSVDEIRAAERFQGDAPMIALTGGEG